MSLKQRVAQQPAWVLHTLPWRETSLIVEVFTRDHGRIALVAKGARRPMSELRGVLMAFQPLLLDFSGGGEVKTLTRGEWRGAQAMLTGRALLCAYYLNELLLKLTAREDSHPALFDAYESAIGALGRGESLPPMLRRFELALLRELGYGVMLDSDGSGQPFRSGEPYLYIIERGPWPCSAEVAREAGEGVRVDGQTLVDLAANDLSRAETLHEAGQLLRTLIHHHLGGQPLQSRRVLDELRSSFR
ncbi:MAG: DNA repair protein RecO [Betaproteobacteria bacterium]|nr:DNA repair protein RecO [Betaproteobacteria bacterium]